MHGNPDYRQARAGVYNAVQALDAVVQLVSFDPGHAVFVEWCSIAPS